MLIRIITMLLDGEEEKVGGGNYFDPLLQRILKYHHTTWEKDNHHLVLPLDALLYLFDVYKRISQRNSFGALKETLHIVLFYLGCEKYISKCVVRRWTTHADPSNLLLGRNYYYVSTATHPVCITP